MSDDARGGRPARAAAVDPLPTIARSRATRPGLSHWAWRWPRSGSSSAVRQAMAEGGIGSAGATVALYAFAAGTLLLLIPAVRGWLAARRAKEAIPQDLVTARVATAAGQTWSGVAIGYAAAALLVVDRRRVHDRQRQRGRPHLLLPAADRGFVRADPRRVLAQRLHLRHRRDPGAGLGPGGRHRPADPRPAPASRSA